MGIFKCFCLSGFDHRQTNAKNVFVSLNYVWGSGYLAEFRPYFISESSSGFFLKHFFGHFFYIFCQYFLSSS